MRTAGLITAAGLSSRAGGFKPMMQLGSISIVHRLILTLRQAGCFPIVLVTGHLADELERHVKKLDVICIRNEKYAESEMFDSAKLGLDYLQSKCDRLLFTPVDVPLFTVHTLQALLGSDADFAVPSHGGEAGHPLLIRASMIPPLLEYSGSGGLSAAVAACGMKTLVEVDDSGILWDVDTPLDYETILKRHSAQLMRPLITVRIAREEAFFGPGLALLLTVIDDCGTVQEACQRINLSYSKGWAILNTAERELGYPLVNRQQGGKSGGGSSLTEKGKSLLERYIEFEAECDQLVSGLFRARFPDLS